MNLYGRRRAIAKKKSLLPLEYQQVTWINGSSCIINLEYVPKENPTAIIEMELTEQGDRDIMGFNENLYPSFIINPSSYTWYNRYGSTSATNLAHPPQYNVKEVWEFGRIVKHNGIAINSYPDNIDWSTNTQRFRLFGARNQHAGMKVWYFQLYDGESLVRDLIPCYRKADDVIGMYDLISNAFYVSSVGTFTKGPNV